VHFEADHDLPLACATFDQGTHLCLNWLSNE
jgi:hypothetical protein